MDNTINLVIDFKNIPHKYPFIFANRDSYSSELSHESHMNYFKHKNGGVNILLEGLAGGAIKSGFDAIRQTFFNSSNKAIENEANRLVKEWVKSNPNMTWTD